VRAAFGVAIGISAVDSLLAAFTAVIVLAIIITSPSQLIKGSLAKDTTILQIEKIAADGDAVIPIRLQLDIQDPADVKSIIQLPSTQRAVLEAATAKKLFKISEGIAVWSDRICGGPQCSSLLMTTGAAGSWKMRIRIAGVDPPNERMPKRVRIRIHRLGGGENQNCNQFLLPDGQVHFSAEFTGNGGIAC
jgi:hypothetical protein